MHCARIDRQQAAGTDLCLYSAGYQHGMPQNTFTSNVSTTRTRHCLAYQSVSAVHRV